MFRPLNEDHAVESVKFALLFTRPLAPKTVAKVESRHELWRDALPAKSRLDVDVDVNGRTLKAPAVMFGFLKPDANPVWSMQVGANQIEVECFLYSRWQRVWETAREHFVGVLDIVAAAQEALQVRAMHLTVKDVFLSQDGPISAGDMLKPSNKVPPHALTAKGPWNSYFSWLNEENEDIRTLHACDIDSSFDGEQSSVEVTHMQTRNTGIDIPIGEICGTGFSRLDAIMEAMHQSNKGFISELITNEMAERIGLGVK
ncbi:TIGR04255 family protein [Rhizobium sp.]|uniref:TIGR04255 family protein n=1 Tax=Rhizobium sp. TaxID=391 RepID=UPI0028B119C0